MKYKDINIWRYGLKSVKIYPNVVGQRDLIQLSDKYYNGKKTNIDIRKYGLKSVKIYPHVVGQRDLIQIL